MQVLTVYIHWQVQSVNKMRDWTSSVYFRTLYVAKHIICTVFKIITVILTDCSYINTNWQNESSFDKLSWKINFGKQIIVHDSVFVEDHFVTVFLQCSYSNWGSNWPIRSQDQHIQIKFPLKSITKANHCLKPNQGKTANFSGRRKSQD